MSQVHRSHSVLDQRWEIVQWKLSGLGLAHYDQATRALHSLRQEVGDLVGQLEAPCRCDKCRDCVAADGYERLQEQLETLRSTLEAADDLLGNVYAKGDEHEEKLMRVRVRVSSALKVSFPASKIDQEGLDTLLEECAGLRKDAA